jgi:sugar (pentulose or hexulose) kinase
MLLIGVEQDVAPRVDEAIGQAGFGNEVGVAADLRSLAARVYRGLAERVGESVKQLVQALDRPILSLRICGGGGRNATFCRLVANIFGRPTRVGPIEQPLGATLSFS